MSRWWATLHGESLADLVTAVAAALAAERAKREELAYSLVASEGERELERERAEAAEINFQASERLRQALNEREVRSVTAYNAARERYEAAEAAGQIARELLDEERAEHARTMEQWNALAAALRGLVDHTDLVMTDLNSSALDDDIAQARATLARVEGT